MSELIESGSPDRKDLLKYLILQLHAGTTVETVKADLVRLLGQVPYGLVVEVEQELIEDGMPPSEVQRLCHLHSAALEGAVDVSRARTSPPGHPAQVLRRENDALREEAAALDHACDRIAALAAGGAGSGAVLLLQARVRVNALADVEKHYARKELLLFPYLEKRGITGPPQVMWGKHDEVRALLRGALAALPTAPAADAAACGALVHGALRPLAAAIRDMTGKEDQILLPMCLDALEEEEWWEIARQSEEIGWCLIEPEADWRPASVPAGEVGPAAGGKIRLPGGSVGPVELEAIIGALPIDATFVDADDRVRWFSHGAERVFTRSKAVLGRKVQLCHPPSSVHTVDRILAGFRAGTHDKASFWIQMRGKFVHIEYRALRGADGAYLGCLEVTQDLTEKRALQGEQRLLSWDAPAKAAAPAAAPVEACPAPAPVQNDCAGHDHAGPGAGHPETPIPLPTPPWLEGAAIARRLDARPLLARGVHPLEQVLAELAALGPGEIYELVTPFVPGPLVERARGLGYLAHARSDEPGTVRTAFTRGAVA
jgi:uncharacterized protein